MAFFIFYASLGSKPQTVKIEDKSICCDNLSLYFRTGIGGTCSTTVWLDLTTYLSTIHDQSEQLPSDVEARNVKTASVRVLFISTDCQ